MMNIEQHAVQGGEHAVHDPGQEQERSEILRHPVLDHRPARQHHQHGDEAVQQDEQHRDPVHPEVVVDIEVRNPRRKLDELHAGRLGIEAGVERDGHEEAEQRPDQRDGARQGCVAIAARRKDQQAREDRDPDRKTQQV
jgi:hypothetical protein